MRRGKLRLWAACLTLMLAAAPALAGEGDALLSPEDLQNLQGSYEAFLNGLEDVLVKRGLLTQEERDTWHAAQMGDYYSNGGYGSILISYQPGALNYVREEEMTASLSCMLGENRLSLQTMRRYSPGESLSDGLALTWSLTGAGELPRSCVFQLTSTAGLFSRWDALMGGYAAVGTGASTDGETLVWSAPVPAEDAANAEITAAVTDAETGEEIGSAVLTLRVDGESYVLDADALNAKTE